MSDDDSLDELERRRRRKAAENEAAQPEDAVPPKTQAEKSRSRRGGSSGGGGPRPAAVGFGDGFRRFRAGQNVKCRVEKREAGGYAVLVNGNLKGFLPHDADLGIGQDVIAHFVCISNGRLLLAPRLS